jgi:hypothetical protein
VYPQGEVYVIAYDTVFLIRPSDFIERLSMNQHARTGYTDHVSLGSGKAKIADVMLRREAESMPRGYNLLRCTVGRLNAAPGQSWSTFSSDHRRRRLPATHQPDHAQPAPVRKTCLVHPSGERQRETHSG